MILSVAITGHRSLADDPDRSTDVAASLGRVLDTLSDAASPAPLRLVTMLAEGADLIAAAEAFRRSIPVAAILPGSAQAYRKTFERADWLSHFDLALAGATSVVSLPCEAVEDADFERANGFILAQSDLLLAVWDGRPARGRGGSGDVVGDAVRMGMPVVVIDPAAPHGATLIVTPGAGEPSAQSGGFASASTESALFQMVGSILDGKASAANLSGA